MAADDPVASAVDTLIEANRSARAALLEAVDGLTEAQQGEGWFGEEQWSVRDLLAHIYEWQNGFAHALERVARGERPEIPDYNPEDPDGVFNAMATERNRRLTWEDLLGHLRAARERHEAAVRILVGMIDSDRFVEGRTAHRLADSAEHDHEHTPAILEWRRQQGT
jgi:hypothetical protein